MFQTDHCFYALRLFTTEEFEILVFLKWDNRKIAIDNGLQKRQIIY